MNEKSFMQTFTGKRFFPMEPHPEDFDILDIGHSLSLQCRFNGHCLCFYSVAEHCVRVSELLEKTHNSGMLTFWGLLHDASEAYLGDIVRPLKFHLPEYGKIEKNVEKSLIIGKFNLPWPMPPEVKWADDVLLATEKRDLLCPVADQWRATEEPLSERISPMTSDQAMTAYIHAFNRAKGWATQKVEYNKTSSSKVKRTRKK